MVAKNWVPLWGPARRKNRLKFAGGSLDLICYEKGGGFGWLPPNHPLIYCSAFAPGVLDFICYEKGVRGSFAEGFARAYRQDPPNQSVLPIRETARLDDPSSPCVDSTFDQSLNSRKRVGWEFGCHNLCGECSGGSNAELILALAH
jgi:hypothetical protein